MPVEPLVIFDGRCGFCRIWINYWKTLTSDKVAYAASQETAGQYPQIPPENFGKSVQLVLPGGEVASGARAVFMTLTYARHLAWLFWAYRHIPGFAAISEAAYCWIADHRTFSYHLTRLTFGSNIRPLKTARVEWLFLRLLAAVYFIAFSSLVGQITGLIGQRGILPASRFLAAVLADIGARAYWEAPTIFWFTSTDRALLAVCWTGVAFSVLLFLGLLRGPLQRAALLALYVLYLSICTAGQDFLGFQWDSLLLETGFLAIFLGNSKIVVLLFRWIIFRLMFLSGVVKLQSHDPVWRNLTALAYHYLTQPLPTPLAWYMYQLPLGVQKFSTALVFVIELGVPFLFFAPRMWRLAGATAAIFLQVMIFLTGNYTFFNLLAIALCLFLFDDYALAKFRLRPHTLRTSQPAVVAITAIVLFLSISELWQVFSVAPGPANAAIQRAAPFQVVNTYGLFATMTVTRPEIIVQGSNDGVTWVDYGFAFQPQLLSRAPRWVAPYQPRLDWQMWFAALGDARTTPWFGNFMARLLQGSPDVLRLLGTNPFPRSPPKYVRAELFDYGFTTFAQRRATGDWWTRMPQGVYFPAVSLGDLR